MPAVGAVILLRPTQSLVLALQQIGRGMRPADGKVALVVLDHAGNTLTHWLPDEPREWSLAGAPARPAKGEAAAQWVCPNCDCLNPLGIGGRGNP